MIIYLGDLTHELGLLWLHDLRADKQAAPLRSDPSYFQADRERQTAMSSVWRKTASPVSTCPAKHQIMLH